MNTKTAAVEVEFYYHKGNDDLFAFFTNELYNKSPKLRACYSHVGQHSCCNVDYLKECELATPEQYAPLKKELESIGYELIVLNEML